MVRVTENADYDGERDACVVLVRGERRKEKKTATREGLRREMSKCLFMPNWATDEPVAISDNSLSRRKEETSTEEGKEGAALLQRGNEEAVVGRCRRIDGGSKEGGSY